MKVAISPFILQSAVYVCIDICQNMTPKVMVVVWQPNDIISLPYHPRVHLITIPPTKILATSKIHQTTTPQVIYNHRYLTYTTLRTTISSLDTLAMLATSFTHTPHPNPPPHRITIQCVVGIEGQFSL